jgi:hypothetical protein
MVPYEAISSIATLGSAGSQTQKPPLLEARATTKKCIKSNNRKAIKHTKGTEAEWLNASHLHL